MSRRAEAGWPTRRVALLDDSGIDACDRAYEAKRGAGASQAACVILASTMTRSGKTVTFSISVDEETQRILKVEAKRSYGGNVSALVTAIAREAKRQSALAWLLQRSGQPAITDAERDALLAEIDGVRVPAKRRSRAA